jgi:hypothetical protein
LQNVPEECEALNFNDNVQGQQNVQEGSCAVAADGAVGGGDAAAQRLRMRSHGDEDKNIKNATFSVWFLKTPPVGSDGRTRSMRGSQFRALTILLSKASLKPVVQLKAVTQLRG